MAKTQPPITQPQLADAEAPAGRLRNLWHKPAFLVAVLVLALLAVVVAVVVHDEDGRDFVRVAGTPRTIARDADGRTVAVLTEDARTVVFTGPKRTFAEPATTGATVTTSAVIRLAPRPWHPGAQHEDWFKNWFNTALTDHGPDVLDIAAQYVRGTADRHDDKGIRYAGPATYGPMGDDDERQATADFNDYLGIDWTDPNGRHREARNDFYGSLDCSGFVRTVYGYRSGYPLEFKQPTGQALPRRAVMMAEDGPGADIIANSHRQATDLSPLQPGDLVFFDATPDVGHRIDHVGIYLGIDSTGHHRFISSRKTANGPTMGDEGGTSLLDGTGLYAHAFRMAKRL
ncbi:C40 family peptidase [Streptomyces sp. NPDC059928]|uniref:C40 family peptidase n=1 Tax=unclassified Streptomyces TaxID=2593676 RepID=UPI0036502F2C